MNSQHAFAFGDSPARIVEFVFPGEPRQQLSLVLPLIAHLSHQDAGRWLTCIGPVFLGKQDCQQLQLNWRRLLQVLPNQRVDTLELCERALAAGRSHTVVCLCEEAPTAEMLVRLERAAAQGGCQGIMIHGR